MLQSVTITVMPVALVVCSTRDTLLSNAKYQRGEKGTNGFHVFSQTQRSKTKGESFVVYEKHVKPIKSKLSSRCSCCQPSQTPLQRYCHPDRESITHTLFITPYRFKFTYAIFYIRTLELMTLTVMHTHVVNEWLGYAQVIICLN